MSPRETPRRDAPAKTTGDGAGAAPGSSSEPPFRSRSRKPYRPPRLVVYGSLTEITRFGGSEVVDSGGGLGALP
jgi:hypothetical protein